MRIRGVDFVQITVPNGEMAAAKAFYGGVLGLLEDGIMNESWAEYRAGAVTIALDADPFLPPPWDREPGGELRIALAVDDVAEAVRELRQKGVEPVFGPEVFDPCSMASVRDPFGNLVILHRRTDGTAG